jgi:acetyl esterase/lipase
MGRGSAIEGLRFRVSDKNRTKTLELEQLLLPLCVPRALAIYLFEDLHRLPLSSRTWCAVCFRAMNRYTVGASLSIPCILVAGVSVIMSNAGPASAQAPAAPPAHVAATITAPPGGFAQRIVLWPNGAPGAQGTTEGDIPAVIVMPGGGYTHEVMEQEGAYEAKWLAAHGVQAFVLEYRLSPAYGYPAPMQDASRAIRYVRSHAGELGIRPDAIGVWGFSAGGHLSGYMATTHKAGDAAAKEAIDRVSDRPDFAILSYAPLTMELYAKLGFSPLKTLIGDHATQQQIDAVDPLKHVSADTSPCFIYSTTGDKTVDSRNAAEFYVALKAAGIPAELHIFELGAHGTHMGEDLPPAMHELTVTPALIADWMQLHGWMAADAQ